MAGVKGMHARLSTSPHYAEKVRARIKAGGIVHRLQKHVLGEVQMSSTQVQAALGLLAKCVPNLAQMEHTGEVTHNYVARTPEVAASTEDWSKTHAPQAAVH